MTWRNLPEHVGGEVEEPDCLRDQSFAHRRAQSPTSTCLVEGFRRNRNVTPKFLALNGWRYTCARRCSSRALMLLPTEHSLSPSALMSQARELQSRRSCYLLRGVNLCQITPTKWCFRPHDRDRSDPPRAKRFLTCRAGAVSVSTTCRADLSRSLTQDRDPCRSSIHTALRKPLQTAPGPKAATWHRNGRAWTCIRKETTRNCIGQSCGS